MSNPLEQEPVTYPNVQLKASVSPDGGRITVVFPHEFIGANVAFTADNWGRHRVLIEPTYGGREVVGFVDSEGVKHGKIEINPAELGLTKLHPGKTSGWWAKHRETDLLIGTLLTDLRIQERVAVAAYPATPEPRQVVIQKPITIEDALTFINQWAKENDASLLIEGGELSAEIRKRWGGKSA